MKLAPTIILTIVLAGCGSNPPDTADVKSHMSSEQLEVGEPIVNSVGMVLVPIPAGEFKMGLSVSKKTPKEAPETPQRNVKITEPFYLSACEVTQEQYEAVMGARPWADQPLVEEGSNNAASYITWEDAVEFCKKLSKKEGAEYRLPTEAEWEYACRAGTKTAFSFGDDGEQLDDYAWYSDNAYNDGEQYAHPVGQKMPNAWGLYDMHGNVWEWCEDWYGRYDGEEGEKVVDPTGPEKGPSRVWRGGSFLDPPNNLRSANRVSHGRVGYQPEYLAGIRVVRTINSK